MKDAGAAAVIFVSDSTTPPRARVFGKVMMISHYSELCCSEYNNY